MLTQTVTITQNSSPNIIIGRRSTYETQQVIFDVSWLVQTYGEGTAELLIKRPKDASAYPVVAALDGNTLTWTVSDTDTQDKGHGECEIYWYVNGGLAKSCICGITILRDIGDTTETAPDPYETWVDELARLGAETLANAQAAEQSAENAAESAEDAAQSAASAEGYAGQAETAAGLAQTAQTASEAARDDAQAAQASAESSATAASGSAASASGSATAAAGSASDASASATAAGASATAAGNAATQAEAAKTAAQAAQSAAEDAAEDAQQAAQQAHVEYEQLSGEVDDLSDEVAQQKSAIEALDSLVDRKAGALIDTASGAIASFVPDATIDNLLGVSVDIEPVQDLHGYDSPWPAGGGKNKIYFPEYSEDDYYFPSTPPLQFTVDVVNQTITLVCIGSGQTLATLKHDFPAGQYTISFDTTNYTKRTVIRCFDENGNKLTNQDISVSGGTWNAYYKGWYLTTGTFIVPSEADHYWIGVGVADDTRDTQVVLSQIQLESGSTASAWTPYENLCPISGRDSVEVEADGVNLWNKTLINGSVEITDLLKPGETYTASGKKIDTSRQTYLYLCAGENAETTLGYIIVGSRESSFTFTVESGVRYWLYSNASYTNIADVQIEPGSAATDYRPYAGTTHTIQLGETVYGGTLDATNGVLTVDRAMVDLGTLTWVYDSAYPLPRFHAVVPNMKVPRGQSQWATGILSSQYTPSQIPITAVNVDMTMARYNGQIYIIDSRFTDADTFKAAMSGVQLCYELATPIIIQLDPVQIATIANQTNNVWADAGDVTVEFAADLKHYIDSKIAAAVAALS